MSAQEFADMAREVGPGSTGDMARAEETGVGQCYKFIFEKRIESRRKDVETKPKRGGEEISKGVEYNLGYIACLRELLQLPEDAREFLARQQNS